MTLGDQLVALLFLYGLPVLFGCTAVCCFGVPMPGLSLLLVAAGSYAQQAEWSLGEVLLGGVLAAVAGDVCGFGLARAAGQPRILGWAARLGLREPIRKAVDYQKEAQGPAIFLSRWLVPLGPWVNFNCGMSDYPWPRFLAWSLLGQSLWVLLYVVPGYLFSDRVQELAQMLGDLSWVSVGLLVVAMLIWQIRKGHSRAAG